MLDKHYQLNYIPSFGLCFYLFKFYSWCFQSHRPALLGSQFCKDCHEKLAPPCLGPSQRQTAILAYSLITYFNL